MSLSGVTKLNDFTKKNSNGHSRVALVTGGIGGIGTEICKRLISQGRTVVAGHLPDEEEAASQWQREMQEAGYPIDLVSGDVSNFDSSKQMVSDVVNRYGSVHILVNCAGITRDKMLRKMDEDMWSEVLTTNLDSAFNVTRHVVDSMINQEFGRIVNISSVNGQKGQFGQTNYSAAKAGLHGFTMALAQELANKGITVNTISPGYVDTRMTRQIPDEIREQIVATIPVGRMANPGEIAQVVAFLCDDENNYMTGANLPVNGGMYMT